jgi:hypothetical protein
MPLTFIDTNKLPKKASAGQGHITEVLNEALCGVRNVHGSLRWLKSAETFKPDVADKHQLIYFMEGKGCVSAPRPGLRCRKGCGYLPRPVRDGDYPGGERSDAKAFSSRNTADTEVKIGPHETWANIYGCD